MEASLQLKVTHIWLSPFCKNWGLNMIHFMAGSLTFYPRPILFSLGPVGVWLKLRGPRRVQPTSRSVSFLIYLRVSRIKNVITTPVPSITNRSRS